MSHRYGAAHRALRRALVAAYVPGETRCALCRRAMADDERLLDLAHKPDGTYAGLAHRKCNRAESQAEINRARAARERLGRDMGVIAMPRRGAEPRSVQRDPPGRSATRW